MTDTLFIQGVTQLAAKYGVEVRIDFDNYLIDFQGECTDEMALALELDEMFGKMAAGYVR